MTVRTRSISVLAKFFMVVFGVAALAGATLSSQATSGTFDPTFSGDGYVGENCGSAAPLPVTCSSPARAVAMQPDGRFVLAGAQGGAFRLWRYTANGERDSPWVSALVDFGTGASANDVAIQSDGRIVAVGQTANGAGFAIARYLADGTLDTTFGTNGTLIVPMGYGLTAATNIVIQPDGTWLIAGWAAWQPDAVRQFALTRLLPSGQVDTSFGTNGRAYMRFVGNAATSGLAVDADGRIVMSGLIEEAGTIPRAFAAARYLPDGVLDTSFGLEGRAVLRGPQLLYARALAVQADGRVVVGGTAHVPGNLESRRFVLIRWTTNGALDPEFGSGGVASTIFPSGRSELNALVLQSDGNLVAGGQVGSSRMAFARYLPDGTLDPAFGMDGLVTYSFSSNYVNDLVIQPDAKIVAAGAHVTSASPFCPGGPCGGGPMPAMARLLP